MIPFIWIESLYSVNSIINGMDAIISKYHSIINQLISNFEESFPSNELNRKVLIGFLFNKKSFKLNGNCQ